MGRVGFKWRLWVFMCLGLGSIVSSPSLALGKSNYFWFGPHQFLVCESLLSQAQLTPESKNITAMSLLKVQNRLGPQPENIAYGYDRVNVLSLKAAKSNRRSPSRIKQLHDDLKGSGESDVQVFGFELRGENAIRSFYERVLTEMERLDTVVSEELKKSFPFPLKGKRPSLVLGMSFALIEAGFLGATPFVVPAAFPLWFICNMVMIDQLAERTIPAIARTDNSSLDAIDTLLTNQNNSFFHLGRDFQILADTTDQWEQLLKSGQSVSDVLRLAALEDNIVGKEFFHEMWRLFQLYEKDSAAYATFLKDKGQEIEKLIKMYVDSNQRPTKMGVTRFLASERSGLNRRTYTDLIGFIDNGEPVLTYVVRAFKETPVTPPRRQLKEVLLERLRVYAELLKSMKDKIPVYN